MATNPSRTRKTAATPIRKDKVHFNLDTYEKEGGEKEPFTAFINGRTIVMTDPTDLSWQELEDLDDPDRFAELVMTKEDGEFFLKEPLKAWQLNGLMDGYMTHYGLGSRGNGRA